MLSQCLWEYFEQLIDVRFGDFEVKTVLLIEPHPPLTLRFQPGELLVRQPLFIRMLLAVGPVVAPDLTRSSP